MLAASPAHAFYHSNEQSGSSIFQKERCYGPWDKGEKVFALYDNLNSPLDKLSQGSVVCPRSDQFVPADVFMGNIPLRIAIRQPMTMENSLNALVYANLMVRKLIEEQEAQQERAREVLAGLRVPFMDFRMSFLERARTQQGVGSYEPSLGPTSTESLASFGNRLRDTRKEPLHLSGRPVSGNAGRRPLYLDSRPVRRTGSGGVVSDVSPPESDIEVSHSESPQHQKTSLAYEDRYSLPLVLRVPLKIAKYLFSHKIEALVYALLLYFLIIMLKSLRSRGDS